MIQHIGPHTTDPSLAFRVPDANHTDTATFFSHPKKIAYAVRIFNICVNFTQIYPALSNQFTLTTAIADTIEKASN